MRSMGGGAATRRMVRVCSPTPQDLAMRESGRMT